MNELESMLRSNQYLKFNNDKKIAFLKGQISIGLEKIDELTLEYKRYDSIY